MVKPESHPKTVELKNPTSGETIEMGVSGEITRDQQNKLSSFAKPDQSGGNPERRALNLNQIKETWKVKTKINDEIAEGLNNYSSVEEMRNKLDTMYKSGGHLELIITQQDGTEADQTIKGYMVNKNEKHNPKSDAAQYQYNITFLKSVPMTS